MSRDERNYLAIDLGASSGRVVLGTLQDDMMRLSEIHRFPTPLLEREGHLYWDVDGMWVEIRLAIEQVFTAGHELRSISVDSWAVDYVPLDSSGVPLRLPYSYRDQRIAGRLDVAIQLAGGADALYDRTGIQFLPFNTLTQIIADIEDEPNLVSRTATRLLIADYFLYRLSGQRVAEATMASTTQLVDARTGQWSSSLLAAIGDDASRWPRIVPCGTALGMLLPELVPTGVTAPPTVVAGCSHDTAAAVAAVPAVPGGAWAFISSGTWSLVGTELDSPLLTKQAREAGFTNEAGLDGTVRFLKNRAGMWVLEECRREWAAQGMQAPHDVIIAAAEISTRPHTLIDLNAPQFAERGNMVRKLQTACESKGMRVPTSHGEIARLVLESLAASHAEALDQLESVVGTRANDVHIVGGGAMNNVVNQLTADRTGHRVLAGPEEATVLGNLLVQARTLGDLPDGVTVRDAARRSTRTREFTPRRAGSDLGSASLAL